MRDRSHLMPPSRSSNRWRYALIGAVALIALYFFVSSSSSGSSDYNEAFRPEPGFTSNQNDEEPQIVVSNDHSTGSQDYENDDMTDDLVDDADGDAASTTENSVSPSPKQKEPVKQTTKIPTPPPEPNIKNDEPEDEIEVTPTPIPKKTTKPSTDKSKTEQPAKVVDDTVKDDPENLEDDPDDEDLPNQDASNADKTKNDTLAAHNTPEKSDPTSTSNVASTPQPAADEEEDPQDLDDEPDDDDQPPVKEADIEETNDQNQQSDESNTNSGDDSSQNDDELNDDEEAIPDSTTDPNTDTIEQQKAADRTDIEKLKNDLKQKEQELKEIQKHEDELKKLDAQDTEQTNSEETGTTSDTEESNEFDDNNDDEDGNNIVTVTDPETDSAVDAPPARSEQATGAWQGTPVFLHARDLDSETSPCNGILTPKPIPQSMYFLHVPKAGGSALAMRLNRMMFQSEKNMSVKENCFSFKTDGTPCSAKDWEDTPNPTALPIESSESAGCRRVINCLDHKPNIRYLGVDGVPSVILLRDPLARLVSGWFFGYPHHPKGDLKFHDYIGLVTHTDITTRMLAGLLYPYSPENITERGWETARRNIEKFNHVLIQEAWETSIRLLLAQYGYAIGENSAYLSSEQLRILSGSGKARVNSNKDYESFKARIISNRRWTDEIRKNNERDYEIYDTGIAMMCEQLRHTPCLLKDPVVVNELYAANLCQELF